MLRSPSVLARVTVPLLALLLGLTACGAPAVPQVKVIARTTKFSPPKPPIRPIPLLVLETGGKAGEADGAVIRWDPTRGTIQANTAPVFRVVWPKPSYWMGAYDHKAVWADWNWDGRQLTAVTLGPSPIFWPVPVSPVPVQVYNLNSVYGAGGMPFYFDAQRVLNFGAKGLTESDWSNPSPKMVARYALPLNNGFQPLLIANRGGHLAAMLQVDGAFGSFKPGTRQGLYISLFGTVALDSKGVADYRPYAKTTRQYRDDMVALGGPYLSAAFTDGRAYVATSEGILALDPASGSAHLDPALGRLFKASFTSARPPVEWTHLGVWDGMLLISLEAGGQSVTWAIRDGRVLGSLRLYSDQKQVVLGVGRQRRTFSLPRSVVTARPTLPTAGEAVPTLCP